MGRRVHCREQLRNIDLVFKNSTHEPKFPRRRARWMNELTAEGCGAGDKNRYKASIEAG
jgi:hypothetical protein